MTEIWIELRIPVPTAGVDLVCHELDALGCGGVIVMERQLDTFVAPDPDEAPSAEEVIRAFFPRPPDVEALRERVRERLAWLAPLVPGLVPVRPEAVPVRQEDWAQGWKQCFGTVRIGRRLVIKPSWEEFVPGPRDVVVTLDPGMAFGTGTHGTTRLCLEALARLFDGPSPPGRVLDVGTGSGILAIAAAALGAHRVLACEIDSEACRVARENVARNGVTGRVEVTEAPLAELEGGFEAVVANILAEENVRLARELVRRLVPGGSLILSGILLEKEDLVIRGFAPHLSTPPEIFRRDDWSCLVYRKEF